MYEIVLNNNIVVISQCKIYEILIQAVAVPAILCMNHLWWK